MNLDELLTTLTPERVRQVVEELAGERPPGMRVGADIGTVVRRIVIQAAFEGTRSYEAIKAAVRSAIERAPGLRYIETPG